MKTVVAVGVVGVVDAVDAVDAVVGVVAVDTVGAVVAVVVVVAVVAACLTVRDWAGQGLLLGKRGRKPSLLIIIRVESRHFEG
jgi:hypothetical protein